MSKRKRMTSQDDPRPAEDVLAQLFAGLGLDVLVRDRKALALWSKIVGPEIAQRSKAVQIREGILFVNVTSASWSQELHFMKSMILQKYADELGQGKITDIRFTHHRA
ncbi:MAG: DUF721 domain-containing protein [bacterium]|nr:DUF721 domain-containing protein [bacterium]